MNMKQFAAALCLIVVLSVSSSRGSGRINIVVGTEAPRLEKFAAQEMAAQFRRLFDAKVVVSESPAKQPVKHQVLLGNPATNPHIKTHFAHEWPELTDQGIFIRSTRTVGQPALLVGGGSPVATLWAAYELGHRFGVRYMLHGDIFPAEPVPVRLEGLNVTMEPQFRARAWETIGDFACGSAAWGLEEHKRAIGQLAKLKFNRVVLSFSPWQPFVHYTFRGVPKSLAQLWHGAIFRVDGDTAGRRVFKGAAEFRNPDFLGQESYGEITAAATKLASGIIDAAHELGMTAALSIAPLEFPPEFKQVLLDARLHGQEELIVGPGTQQSPTDPVLLQLTKTKIRAYLTTYPNIDVIYLALPELPDWFEHDDLAWNLLDAQFGIGKQTDLQKLLAAANRHTVSNGRKRRQRVLQGNITSLAFLQTLLTDPNVLQRANHGPVPIVVAGIDPALFFLLDQINPENAELLHGIDRSARGLAADTAIFDRIPPASAKSSSLMLTLHDEDIGPLPQCALGHLHKLLDKLRRQKWSGFVTTYPLLGDSAPVLHYLARASFDAEITPEQSLDDFFTAVCGAGTVASMTEFYNMLERATNIIYENDPIFALPVPGVVMKHYNEKGLPPEWWKQTLARYGDAYNEIGRALHRSDPQGRLYLTYTLKRMIFASTYFRTLQALRLASHANQDGDSETEVEQFQTALDLIHDGLRALAEQTRCHSDLGTIAILNAYGYHPMLRKLDELHAAEDNLD